MEVSILKEGTGTAEITVNGKKLLAVTTNLNSKIYKQISRQKLLSEPGLLIKGKEYQNWLCTDSIEYEGKLLFYGSYIQGKSLADSPVDYSLLLNIAYSFQYIENNNIPFSGLYTPGVLRLNKGDILLFPPLLINYMTCNLTENENLHYFQPYNHPDAQEEAKFTFILGVLFYEIITGKKPFTGDSSTEIRERMRTSPALKVEILEPAVKNDIGNLINSSLELKSATLADWITLLKKYQKKDILNTTDKENRKQQQDIARKKQEQRDKNYKRKQFFSHNWKILAISAVVFIAFISFIYQPIKKAFEPPVTAGMTAEEVVSTFYESLKNLDSESLEDCVQKGVAKNDIREVMNIYVISKVRTGYEGNSGLISAQDWKDGKITSNNQGDQVYGIADLKITKVTDTVFKASYSKWYPEANDNSDSVKRIPSKMHIVKDILTLEKIKKVWVIVKLDRKITE